MMAGSDTIPPLTSLPYHEPSMVIVLVLASFLLFVNFGRKVASKFVGAGLLGEIIVGSIYSASLSSILPASVQYSLQSFGYLGLLLLIVDGGLNTRIDILTQRTTALLAITTGLVGILLPIGISLAILPLAFGFGWIETFACGAALASTSLGTVFSVIASTNENMAADQQQTPPSAAVSDQGKKDGQAGHDTPSLADTRVGTILVGAALLDDIVGLVLSSVVTNLSSGQAGVVKSLAPWTVARPVVASVCLLLVASMVSRWVLTPLLQIFGRLIVKFILILRGNKIIAPWVPGFAIFAFLAVISAFSTIAFYIGSSNLIGAFTAGACLAYGWKVFERSVYLQEFEGSEDGVLTNSDREFISTLSPQASLDFIQPLGAYFLIPFFFASIGAAIPMKAMFVGSIIWKGFIYTGLMGTTKMLAGGSLLIAGLVRLADFGSSSVRPASTSAVDEVQMQLPSEHSSSVRPFPSGQAAFTTPPEQLHRYLPSTNPNPTTDPLPRRLRASWPAALFLGVCLVARGEIGFLIINLAFQGGLVSEDAFLISTWAITLNTIIGPASIGIFLKTKTGRSIERGVWGRVKVRS